MSHLFISYSHEDRTIVDRLRQDLSNAGLSIWIDKIGLKPGTSDWEEALREAIGAASAVLYIASPNAWRSVYVRDELALARDAKKPIYPLWIAGERWMECVPLGYGSTQNLDLREDQYASGLARLIGALTGSEPSLGTLSTESEPLPEPPAVPRNPYKGLRAFREEDQDDFFGRDLLIADLLDAIGNGRKSPRLRALLGASGSGKSSIMMAGLLPRLRTNHPDWSYLDPIVPGAQPLEHLTIVLARQLKRAQADIRKDLDDRSRRGLHRLASEIADKPVVLYIDQFEELFTQTTDEAERRQIIDLLTCAATEPDGVLNLLLTMRADFYDRPAQYTEFGTLIEAQHTLMTPMRLADLFDVVLKPATLPDVQISFDDGLVNELVSEVREEASALPLLQFTLDQLFQRREGQRLTLDAYRAIGELRGALAKHAEATYEALPSDEHRRLARTLFLRLIEPGQTEQETTRRRARLRELQFVDSERSALMQVVVRQFVDARLLTTDLADVDETVEVSHEALIREWERLGSWLHEAREDVFVMKRIAADAEDWAGKGKPAGLLYGDRRLTEAQAWASRNHANPVETEFLSTSQQQQSVREKREAASRRNLRYALISLFGVIMLASIGLALIFAQNNATLQAEAATLQAVAATSEYRNAYAQAQVNFAATRQFGISPFDITQTPAAAFIATATAYADADVAWEPVTETFDAVEMVLVPAGCFYMGSNESRDEQPIQELCFDEPFWIDKYEVTNEAYGSVGCSDYSSEPDQPRNCVSWFDARDHCETRSARLPTEAEWEYAARGPGSPAYPWGNVYDAGRVIDVDDPTYGSIGTAPVGIRALGASWVGAMDMSGNVLEWVSSLYKDYPYGYDHESNSATSSPRVLRGGSFFNISFVLRSAYRFGFNPVDVIFNIGFRCARSS